MLSIGTTFCLSMALFSSNLVLGFASSSASGSVNINVHAHPDLVPDTGSCTMDLNCSLNGECREGVCLCDDGWGGLGCATMQLLPVSFPQGYGMQRSLQADVNTSWGGNVIQSGGKFHMFVNAIANQCLLGAWMVNSRIDHVISDTVTGPYTYVDTAIGTCRTQPPWYCKTGLTNMQCSTFTTELRIRLMSSTVTQTEAGCHHSILLSISTKISAATTLLLLKHQA
eukprot:m.263398 g.263398  ORF g.263398 m.263398 type:complete len:226 (-) comp50329_c0_seq1:706-1383(-)